MKDRTATEFFDKMARNYAAGDFVAIAGQYDLPGALYLEEDVVVWPDQPALIRFLEAHCRCNFKLGARSVRPTIAAQSLRRDRHFSVWVDWEHLDGEGETLFLTQARYFLRAATGGVPVIQLVEVPNRPACYASTVTAAPFRRAPAPAGQHRGPRESVPVPISGVHYYKSA